jgi:hypothetical protein
MCHDRAGGWALNAGVMQLFQKLPVILKIRTAINQAITDGV